MRKCIFQSHSALTAVSYKNFRYKLKGFADKPNFVFPPEAERQSFILAAHYCDAHATYPFRLPALKREIEWASLYDTNGVITKPTRSCSQWGLSCDPDVIGTIPEKGPMLLLTTRCALTLRMLTCIPHLFTLAPVSMHPGGMFSVTLSVSRQVGTPDVIRHCALPEWLKPFRERVRTFLHNS